MAEEKQKRQYTKRTAEEKQIAVINKIEAEIEKLQNSINEKKAVLATEQEKLNAIREEAEKIKAEEQQKEIAKLIKDSGLSLDELKELISKK